MDWNGMEYDLGKKCIGNLFDEILKYFQKNYLRVKILARLRESMSVHYIE
jgi:hypothetical protein